MEERVKKQETHKKHNSAFPQAAGARTRVHVDTHEFMLYAQSIVISAHAIFLEIQEVVFHDNRVCMGR